jgi:hypothetical protein
LTKKKQETRTKKQETRTKSRLRIDFFAPAYRRQVSAPLRAKRRKETRDKKQESADRQISLRLCAFAREKKKRDKRQEARNKSREARD